jgi:hypothetical protein
MFQLFQRVQWVVVDCLSGAVTPVTKLPFEMGGGDGVDLRLAGDGVPDKACALCRLRDRGLCLVNKDPAAPMIVNGAATDFVPLEQGEEYPLVIGPHLLVVRGGAHSDEWSEALGPDEWSLYPSGEGPVLGPMSAVDLCREALAQRLPPESVTAPRGLKMGFYLSQLTSALSAGGRLSGEAADPGNGSGELESEVGREGRHLFAVGDTGDLTCPVCWLRFDEGDALHVAVHDGLRGDPLLGEDAPQRFLATRFNDRGQALDAMGLACTDLACPHCRRVLPPEFTQVPGHILSMVGDQSAGKSYYLSVLIKLLPVSLYQEFGVVLQDADPAGNALLNEMKKTLFSAQSPEQARLVKTQLEGIMYERLPRFGRTVALPRPFVFSLASTSDSRRRCLIIFYDNAGEHFQPGRDSADSPGAQHVASSSGLLFLFDPLNSPEFRARLGDLPDPQLERPVLDQQDVILSELKVRLKKLKRIPAHERVRTPLAVLIGKCDAWLPLLPGGPLLPAVHDGRLDLEAVGRNSERLRRLMLEIAPTIVANAEEISETVRYFAVSSFGHAPVKIDLGDYVPDPRRLKPMYVEAPPLWLLSQVQPGLVATEAT